MTEGRAASKTVVSGGNHVYWEPGDLIKLFSDGRAGLFSTGITEASATATFSGQLGDAASLDGLELWAIYPFSDEASFEGGTISTVLPSEQPARAESFGKGMNLAAAHSTDKTLQFYNVSGGLRFSLSEEGITEIVLESLGGEPMAGNVKIQFLEERPVVTSVRDEKYSITLTPSDGETFLKGTWYFINVLPGAHDKGIRLSFRKESELGQRSFSKTVVFKRGVFASLANADAGAFATVSDDIIAFKDNLVKEIVVRHFDTNEDGGLSYSEAAAVTSFMVDANTRAADGMVSIFAGTGITSFDELVYFTGLTEIEDGAFEGCSELTSVTIPKNVNAIGDNAFNGCTGLESITVTSPTPPSIGTDAFANSGDCPISVPTPAVEEYVSEWSEYAERILPSGYEEPEAIDLGLPSGIKWASFNLGATVPEEYGDYFAWGETETHYSSLDPLKWKEGYEAGYYFMNYKWTPTGYGANIKYVAAPSYGQNGFTDGKTILDPEDDAASVYLGDKWRMPTGQEALELRDNCSYEWTSVNGIDGMMFTGPNGNSIFLPAGGAIFNADYTGTSTTGWYATSSLYMGEQNQSVDLYFESRFPGWGGLHRSTGRPIRPVYGDMTPVTGISFDKTDINILVRESKTLYPSVLPSTASNHAVLWSSSNESIATISTGGIVVGVSPGTAVITAKTAEGGYTASCNVTVWPLYSAVKPEAVDLGLSVKWASFNLGATKPEEFGDYFAWGETEPHYMSLDPLVWKNDMENSGYSFSSYRWLTSHYDEYSKYNESDGKTVLESDDDAASVNLGGKWRMPTQEEVEELEACCAGSYSWTTVNGVGGCRVTGPNGNSIFLPASGCWFWNTFTNNSPQGYYMSSSLYRSSAGATAKYPYGLWFGSDAMGNFNTDRFYGYTIRPVYDENAPDFKEVVLWENDGSTGDVTWGGVYRFALEGMDYDGKAMASFPAEDWDVIKNGTFYLEAQAGDYVQIRVTDGWWVYTWTGNDIFINDERITDNGHGTFILKINFDQDPILTDLDDHNLLFTGSGYTPLKLYYYKSL